MSHRTRPLVATLFAVAALAAAGCRLTVGPNAPARISAGSDAGLRRTIDSLADAPEFQNAHWGILIVDPARGDTLYARNAGKLFMPASNLKILTTAVALARLGSDYTYRTSFAARGPVADGTLDGDLLVVGRGDPSVSDHMLHDAMLPLRAVADSLATRGIKRVAGRIVAAGDAFPGENLGFGWSYDDFEDSYSAPIDELLFNEGFSELHVRGGEHAGDSVSVETRPARTVPRVRVLATTVAAPATTALRAHKDSVTWDVILEGTIAARDTAVIEVTHHDADAAYVAALREALAARGITVDGGATDTLERVDTLVTLTSPPLRDILPALLKPSQNQIAEMLFRTIGLTQTGVGRADSAAAFERRQLAGWGVADDEIVIRDGSGLSRYDFVTPRTIARVLDAMRKSPDSSVYYGALPIAGVDGTIRNRMKGTLAEGNVHAKTGSFTAARSLSGYVTTADHHLLIFSFLCNDFTVPIRSVERVQDAISVRLAGMRLR